MPRRSYTTRSGRPRSGVWIAAVVFMVALVPRVVVWQQSQASPTYAEPEGGDSIFYQRVARGEPGPERAYFHSPLYRGFLTGLYAIAGDGPDAPRVIQHLFGVFTALLCALLAWRLFRRRDVALIAGALIGLSAPLMFYESQLLVDAVLPLLIAGAALAVVEAWPRQESWRWAAAGALIGAAVLGRGVILVWVVVIAALVWRHGASKRRSMLAMLLGLAFVIAPVTIRNYVVERDFVLITANGGLNLYIGNFERAEGAYALPDGLWFDPGDPNDDFAGAAVAAEELGYTPSSSELSTWWAQRALTFALSDPGRVVALIGAKAALLVNDYEHPQLYHFYGYRRVIRALGWLPTAGWILVPGLIGLALVFERSRPGGRRRTFAWLCLAFAASFLPFFVVGRFRAGWLVLLAPFAALAVASAIDSIRRRRFETTARWAAAFAVVAVVVLWPLSRVPTPASQYLAFAYASSGDERVRWTTLAVAAEPDWDLAWARHGDALLEAGDASRSEDVLARAGRDHRRSAEVSRALGRAERANGELAEARESFERALALDPGSVETWVLLAETLAELGEREAAIEAYNSALALGAHDAERIEAALRELDATAP